MAAVTSCENTLFPLLDKWLDVILRLHARYPLPNFLLIKWYAVSTIKTRPNPDVKIAIAVIQWSADLLLSWAAGTATVTAPVSAGTSRKKLEIQIQLNVVIKQMSACLGDARYTIVLLCKRWRSLLRSFWRNSRLAIRLVYRALAECLSQYPVLIHLASLRQRRN